MPLKNWFATFALLLTLPLLLSCSKEEEPEVSNTNEYYVKYEVRNSSIYSGGTVYITYRKEDTKNEIVEMRYNQSREFTIGPVQKGFNCRVALSTSSNRVSLYSTISVSKNGSPFAVKGIDESGNPRDNSVLAYTIDY